MNLNANILFYSRKCGTCKNLITLLQNENFLAYFKMICVDDIGREQLPPQIKMVPTMIVTGVNKPLVAEAAFKWIEQAKFIRQQELADTNKRIIQQNLVNMAKNNKKGPLGFVEQEMTGISDTFAYKDIDKAQPHSYVGAGDENKNSIFTAPEQGKISKNEQLTKIKEMEKDRNEQEENYGQMMKQQQLQAVMKAEQEDIIGSQQNGKNRRNHGNNMNLRDLEEEKQRSQAIQQQAQALQQNMHPQQVQAMQQQAMQQHAMQQQAMHQQMQQAQALQKQMMHQQALQRQQQLRNNRR